MVGEQTNGCVCQYVYVEAYARDYDPLCDGVAVDDVIFTPPTGWEAVSARWCDDQGFWHQSFKRQFDVAGIYPCTFLARDLNRYSTEYDGEVSRTTTITIKAHYAPGSPISCAINTPANGIAVARSQEVTCMAFASDYDTRNCGTSVRHMPTTYTWSATGGSFKDGVNTGQYVTWVAPPDYGQYSISATADDPGDAPEPRNYCGSKDDDAVSTTILVNVSYLSCLKSAPGGGPDPPACNACNDHLCSEEVPPESPCQSRYVVVDFSGGLSNISDGCEIYWQTSFFPSWPYVCLCFSGWDHDPPGTRHFQWSSGYVWNNLGQYAVVLLRLTDYDHQWLSFAFPGLWTGNIGMGSYDEPGSGSLPITFDAVPRGVNIGGDCLLNYPYYPNLPRIVVREAPPPSPPPPAGTPATGGIQNEVHQARISAYVSPTGPGQSVTFSIQGTTGVLIPAGLSLTPTGAKAQTLSVPTDSSGKATAIFTSSDKDNEQVVVNANIAGESKPITIAQQTCGHTTFECDPATVPADGVTETNIRFCLVKNGTTTPVPGHEIEFSIEKIEDAETGQVFTQPPFDPAYGQIIQAVSTTGTDGFATGIFRAGTKPAVIYFKAEDGNDWIP